MSEKIKVGNKYYKVLSITFNDKTGEKFCDVELVDKNYEDNVETVYRRDRFGHQIITKKDGIEETINEKGKVIRRWKNGELIYGDPYPTRIMDTI